MEDGRKAAGGLRGKGFFSLYFSETKRQLAVLYMVLLYVPANWSVCKSRQSEKKLKSYQSTFTELISSPISTFNMQKLARSCTSAPVLTEY